MVEQPGRPSCVGKYTKAVWELHLRIRFLLGTLVLAGPAVADVTATFEWTAPAGATNGQPLVGDHALTGYKFVVDGNVQNLPASATRRDVLVADGDTVSVYLKACNAGGCGAPSETLSFTAPAGESTPPPANEQILWSGIGQGSTPIAQGNVLGGYDGLRTRTTISLSGASSGSILIAYAIRIGVLDGYLRVDWRDGKVIGHPTAIRPERAYDIVFECDRDAQVWNLTVDGHTVTVENAPICVSDSWGQLKVAGAGGTAEIAIYDVAATGIPGGGTPPPPAPTPDPEPEPAPEPPPGDDGTPPSARISLWSGVGQGTAAVSYGNVLSGYAGNKSGVSIQVSGASAGKIIQSYPIQVSIVGGKARAKWQHSKAPSQDALLIHPTAIEPNRTHDITFECDKVEDLWTLIVDGTTVTMADAPKCIGDAWGTVRVTGAGGTAAIEVYDIP